MCFHATVLQQFRGLVGINVKTNPHLYIISGQIIATSHGGLVREILYFRELPLFQGNLVWWNIISNLARLYTHMYVLVGDLSSTFTTFTTFHSCWEGLMSWRDFLSCFWDVDKLKVWRKFLRCSMGLEYLHPWKLTYPLKMMVGRCISYWNSPFLGDMLIFQGVTHLQKNMPFSNRGFF